MDTNTLQERFCWPKTLPELSPEQRRIADDFIRHWPTVVPQRFGAIERFKHRYALKSAVAAPGPRTLEIGAGSGSHLDFEDLAHQDYHCVELRENMAAEIRRRFPQVTTTTADCQRKLPYGNASFDRALAIQLLQRLPRLPDALAELHRVLAPGGLLSVVVPCDSGLAYGLVRKLSAERVFRRRYGQPYDRFIGREHINSPTEIVHLLMMYFGSPIDFTFWPLKHVPLVAANLCIGITYRRDSWKSPEY
jgi:SAM-dependent methyltransferase